MNETFVYTSRGGRAFHGDPACRALRSGQELNDWDDDWVPGCRVPTTWAVERMTIPDTIGSGKLPCLVCLPGYTQAWFKATSEDDFGHEPWGPYDGALHCRRCYTTETREWVDAYDSPRHQTVRELVPWPCTSAVVLGLVPREVVAS